MKTIQKQIFFGAFTIINVIGSWHGDYTTIEYYITALFVIAFIYYSFVTPKD